MEGLASPIISAVAGLVGVGLGGIISTWAHRTERRNGRTRDKLDKFYSPLLGIRMQIRAKSEVRLKISSHGNAAWASLFTGLNDPEVKKQIEAERWSSFEKLIEYADQQLREELIPLYRQMVALFATNMQFAEDTTRQHFAALVEFSELWNRALQNPIPPEVLASLNHTERNLYPFYEDLETQFRRLRKELEE